MTPYADKDDYNAYMRRYKARLQETDADYRRTESDRKRDWWKRNDMAKKKYDALISLYVELGREPTPAEAVGLDLDADEILRAIAHERRMESQREYSRRYYRRKKLERERQAGKGKN